MTYFGLLFITFAYYHAVKPDLFSTSQQQLSIPLGVLNTVLMLSSSLFVALAVQAIRDGLRDRARTLFLLALSAGLAFVGVKAIEWGSKLADGITMMTNDFFRLYFIYTGIHLIHVVIGLGILAARIKKTRRSVAGQTPRFEIGATFWHMVDLLWIMLFAIFYMIG